VRSVLRKLLPFALGLVVGGAAVGFVAWRRADDAGAGRAVSQSQPAQYELPKVRVLSALTIDETLNIQSKGVEWEAARVLHPHGAQYALAEARDYRRGVVQVKFLFGADGRIDEVAPMARRTDCGLCLMYVDRNVEWLDPRDPAARDFVEAAMAAVREIKFVPAKVNGRPYPTHGFAECEFRLD